jgi:hypothetical protein
MCVQLFEMKMHVRAVVWDEDACVCSYLRNQAFRQQIQGAQPEVAPASWAFKDKASDYSKQRLPNHPTTTPL